MAGLLEQEQQRRSPYLTLIALKDPAPVGCLKAFQGRLKGSNYLKDSISECVKAGEASRANAKYALGPFGPQGAALKPFEKPR